MSRRCLEPKWFVGDPISLSRDNIKKKILQISVEEWNACSFSFFFCNWWPFADPDLNIFTWGLLSLFLCWWNVSQPGKATIHVSKPPIWGLRRPQKLAFFHRNQVQLTEKVSLRGFCRGYVTCFIIWFTWWREISMKNYLPFHWLDCWVQVSCSTWYTLMALIFIYFHFFWPDFAYLCPLRWGLKYENHDNNLRLALLACFLWAWVTSRWQSRWKYLIYSTCICRRNVVNY